jgi:hypothetical protein
MAAGRPFSKSSYPSGSTPFCLSIAIVEAHFEGVSESKAAWPIVLASNDGRFDGALGAGL